MNWEVVIGLETHAQLSTVSKIFSGASTAHGAAPNTQASAVELALPGVLPVLNKGAVERAIRFGLAVGGRIAPRSVFARKNYFYPDLPKGYQISQYELPVLSGGQVVFQFEGSERRVQLTRAHLEEDAGKSLHEDYHGMTGIDLNRAGTPLLEIVTEPDMRSAGEAVAYARALHSLVRWIGICDGNMQEGSFRCDANVSVRLKGADKLGTRCEIKNLNSFRFMEKALEYEVRRQVALIEDGGKVVQETRLYDPDRDETRPMRSKEDAQDYRYFPDPDLLPLAITPAMIEAIRGEMGEMQHEARIRLARDCRLSENDAYRVTSDLETLAYFEAAFESLKAQDGLAGAKQLVNWMFGDLAAANNQIGVAFSNSRVAAGKLAGLIQLGNDGELSSRMMKDVFSQMLDNNREARAISNEQGLKQISDASAIEAAIDQVLAANPKQVEDYRAGKEKAFNSLVGQVMKATSGKANPAQVNDILRRKLS